MRYDKNYAKFAGHPEWYEFKIGVGYIPTDKAPEYAKKAMEEYNKYSDKRESYD